MNQKLAIYNKGIKYILEFCLALESVPSFSNFLEKLENRWQLFNCNLQRVESGGKVDTNTHRDSGHRIMILG